MVSVNVPVHSSGREAGKRRSKSPIVSSQNAVCNMEKRASLVCSMISEGMDDPVALKMQHWLNAFCSMSVPKSRF